MVYHLIFRSVELLSQAEMELTFCFATGSDGKESACNVGDLSLIPGLARSPGEGKDYSLQYSVLGNSMDCIVHGVAESDKTDRLSLSLSLSQVRFLHLLI